MRVLFLADAVFEDIPGGSRVVARELARGLAGLGHEVTFLVARQTADAPEDERREGIRIARYPGAGNPLAFVREGRQACARLWTEKPFDIVHTHFAYAALGPLQAVPKTVPHVRSFYGPWDEEGWVEDCAHSVGPLGRIKAVIKRRLRHQVEAANLRRSQRVIVLSEHSRGEVRVFGYPADRVCQVPGGVDVERFTLAQDKHAVRETLNLPLDRRILFSVRRLAPRMGLDHLIKAMPAVVERHPEALLLIGGKGPERERLETLAQEQGMGHHVQMLGFIPDRDLAAFYQAADVFVLPTIALEGFGLVTAEALACGVPVIGTPVGATPELLIGLDPRLVAAGTSPQALAAAILAFWDGDWSNILTPNRLRQHVLAHYTWKRHVDAVEAIYNDLAALRL